MLPSQSHSPLSFVQRTLAANLESIVDVTGTSIWIQNCGSQFTVAFDSQSPFPVDAGFGIELREGDYFKRLTLKSALAQTVKMFVGAGRVFSAGTIIQREAPTRVFSIGPITLAAGADSAPYIYADSALGHVKQVIITNDSTQKLRIDFIWDGDVLPGAIVPANSSFKIDNQVGFQLHNLGAGTATYYLAVFYYL